MRHSDCRGRLPGNRPPLQDGADPAHLAGLEVESIPVGDDGDVVLTFGEWCRLASIGESTGRKLKALGKGPRFVRLTEKKLGVTLREHRRWMKARTE